MFVVYCIYSDAYDKIYVGFTSNLEERFKSHNEFGNKGWTIKFRPWKIIYTEFFENKSEAMSREKQLKSAKGREFLRNQMCKK